MVELKVVVSDPKTGRAYNVDASTGAAGSIVGKKIGDELDAGPLGLAGYKILITGGSDQTGIPARKSLPGRGEKETPARRRRRVPRGDGRRAQEKDDPRP